MALSLFCMMVDLPFQNWKLGQSEKGKFSVFVEHRIRVLDQSFISMEASFTHSIFES